MDREFIIKSSREYLVNVGYNALDVGIFSNDCVLERVNMLYFGGIQAFARKIQNEEATTASSLGIPFIESAFLK